MSAPQPTPATAGQPLLERLPPVRRSGVGVGTALALTGLAVLTLVAIAVVGLAAGPAAVPAAAVLALLPLTAVLLAVRWVDRWEPEPWPALATAFGWGASVSVLVAFALNTGASLLLVATGADATQAGVLGAAVVAPLVEEGIKAAGVLVVVLVWRRSVDGPVDGVVYAAMVGAGFAFVENVLYFAATITASAAYGEADAVLTVFVLRAVVSPFAHVLFTACVGLALGVAARSRHRGAWVWALPLGLVPAVVLHALWNGSAVLGSDQGFWVLYVTVQVPFLLATVALLLWLRRQEGAVVRRALGEYAAAGWFAPQEVAMLASLGDRRRARAWAGAAGPQARAAMTAFQRAATSLAFQRQRVLRERDVRSRADELGLLDDVVRARAGLRAALARR